MNRWIAGILIVFSAVAGASVARAGETNPPSPSPAAPSLVMIPTAVQELTGLRINTGRRALQRDGTVNVVYEMKTPAEGNKLLHVRLELAVDAGPVVLRATDIRLGPIEPDSGAAHTPFDWYLERGLEEVRGDSLTVQDQAVLEFTIEAPARGLDSLILSVLGRRVGSVHEMRERIRRESGK